MTASFERVMAGRSARERGLIGIMIGLIAAMLMWFGIIAPLRSALATARARLDQATLASGQVAVRIAALRRASPATTAPLPAPLTVVLGGSGRDIGLTLTRNEAQGNDRAVIAITSMKSAALFGWLGELARRGITAETITLRPNSDATLAVVATLQVQRP